MIFFLGNISFGAHGQVQIGSTIDGEAANDFSGRSVSLSADGRVLAIGATGNDKNGSNSGHVRVYKKVEDASFPGGFTWVQLGGDIDGEAAGDQSGRSVSLSADGSILAIGAWGNDENGSASGHVRVYERDASDNWVQLGVDIDGEAAGDQSGIGVSLSADGSVLAIGANLNKGINGVFSGHVRVYKKVVDAPSPGGFRWEQLGNDIDGKATFDGSGHSVSLSADGNVLAIGAPDDIFTNTNQGSGYVRVYRRDASDNWVRLGGDIDGEAAGDQSGRSVSLSSDGSVLAIGADRNNGKNGEDSGHVRVYGKVVDATSPGGFRWEQLGDDIDGEVAGDQSGSSLSLSSDGSVLAIRARGNDGINGENSGHVRVYKKIEDAASPDGFIWEQLGDAIDGEAANDELGQSVSLSADGSILAIGAPGNGFNTDFPGHTRIYHIGASGVSIQGAPAAVHATDHFEVTFTFDRGVTDFNKEDIVVTHATVDHFTLVNDSSYTATIAPDISTCGHITMNIPAGAALDVDSNLSNFAAQQVIVEVMDDVPPNAIAKDITVALGTNGQVIINADQINDNSTDNCGVGAMYIESNQVISSEGTFDVKLIVEDVNGNRASAYAKVTVEAPPTVSIDNTPSGVENQEAFTVEIAFSKVVTGFELADIDVTNATVSTLTGSGSTYLATLTPTSLCDDITIDVPTGVATVTNSLLHLPNQAAEQVSIGTEDTIDPTIITCPADVVTNAADNGTGDCTATVNLVNPDAGDNCSVASVVARVNGVDIDPGTYAFSTGATTVTWIVSDGSGNTASCEQTVTVEEDLDNLEAIAKDITVQLDASGQVTILPEDVDDGSGRSGCNNNSDPVFISLDKTTFSCSDVGTVSVVLTARQGGETATATATVTVEATGNCEAAPSFSPMIPTAFTPNGDGANDRWIIDNLSEDASVRIYDRHGTIIFRSDDGYAHPWDGTYRGGSLPTGSYLYAIQNGTHTYRGIVTILL